MTSPKILALTLMLTTGGDMTQKPADQTDLLPVVAEVFDGPRDAWMAAMQTRMDELQSKVEDQQRRLLLAQYRISQSGAAIKALKKLYRDSAAAAEQTRHWTNTALDIAARLESVYSRHGDRLTAIETQLAKPTH